MRWTDYIIIAAYLMVGALMGFVLLREIIWLAATA